MYKYIPGIDDEQKKKNGDGKTAPVLQGLTVCWKRHSIHCDRGLNERKAVKEKKIMTWD